MERDLFKKIRKNLTTHFPYFKFDREIKISVNLLIIIMQPQWLLFYAMRLQISGNQMNFCQRWGIGATYKYLQGYLLEVLFCISYK